MNYYSVHEQFSISPIVRHDFVWGPDSLRFPWVVNVPSSRRKKICGLWIPQNIRLNPDMETEVSSICGTLSFSIFFQSMETKGCLPCICWFSLFNLEDICKGFFTLLRRQDVRLYQPKTLERFWL